MSSSTSHISTKEQKKIEAAERIAKEDIEKSWFVVKEPNANTGPIYDDIRSSYRILVNKLHKLVPPGEDRSVAIRSLQNSMMQANAAVAHHDWEE